MEDFYTDNGEMSPISNRFNYNIIVQNERRKTMISWIKSLIHKKKAPEIPMRKFRVKILYNNDEMLPYTITDARGKDAEEAAKNAIEIIADIGYFGMTPRDKVIARLRAVEIEEIFEENKTAAF